MPRTSRSPLRIAFALSLLLGAFLSLPAFAGEEQIEQGRALLRAKGCEACHALDGAAGAGPSLQGVIENKGEDFVRRSIRDPEAEVAEGYAAGTMPTLDLSEADLDALIAALKEPAQRTPSSIAILALAGALFVLMHLSLSSALLRPKLVARLGPMGFQGLYSLIVLALFAWAWQTWEAAPYVELWPPSPWTRWVPNLGMPLVMILLFAGYTERSPTMMGMEGALADADPARGILRITRHPANVGMVLWGLLHLVPNGDLATVILFGTVISLGVLGTLHIEHRRQVEHGDAWARYVAKTSILPFAAILRGDQRLSLREIGAARILGGLACWGAALWFHGWMVGAVPWPIF